ncbi:hypothetical protein [Streptomyces sp. NPDC090025]|uniref:hypothetical protein n=1 Tax=Streptomyces sp. NPDC090025 TaxID=3365922 RepID=UPI00383928E6
MAAREQCDGAISEAAVPALKRALDSETFMGSRAGWLDRVAAERKSDYDKNLLYSPENSRCAIAARDTENSLDIVFEPFSEKGLRTHAEDPFVYPYEMGVEAEIGYRWSYLYVDCVSPQLKGSETRPARIMGSLKVWRSTTSDTAATREDNLVVLHSVTLALVRKLGCVDDAGLPATPVIKPLKPTKTWPPGPIDRSG